MSNVLQMPADSIRSLHYVAPGVIGLRTLMANLYAVSNSDGSWVLVDTGIPFSRERIVRWLARRKGPAALPTCILLTHGHFDHVGTVAELAQEWNVPVYAHALERPYLTGRSKYPPADPTVGRGIFSLFSPIYPRGPINLGGRLRDLPDDGSVPGLEGWRWIPTPGHSPGHVSFFRESDRVLITGDAFVTTKQEAVSAVVTQRPELNGPPAYFTPDWDSAKVSVARLAALRPDVVACGHGLPMHGPAVVTALDNLAAHFDELARPAHGRYVNQPAITNENGIVRLPPPVVNPGTKIAVGVAVASVLLYGLMRARRA